MTRTASRRNAAFFRVAFDQMDLRPRLSASAQAITRPGNPPPEPRSTQRWRAARGQELQRIGDVAGPELGHRRRRDQVALCACQLSSSSTKRSSRSAVSRETGASASAASRSAASIGSRASCCAPCLRGHAAARDSARFSPPAATCRACGRARPAASALPASCRRCGRPGRWCAAAPTAASAAPRSTARARRVIEIVRQLEAFVAAEGGDIGGLPRQIDVVFGVDLELLGDLRRRIRQAAARSARVRAIPMLG